MDLMRTEIVLGLLSNPGIYLLSENEIVHLGLYMKIENLTRRIFLSLLVPVGDH